MKIAYGEVQRVKIKEWKGLGTSPKTRLLTDSERERREHLFWTVLAWSILLLGALLRFYLVHITPYNVSKHDLGYVMGIDSDKTGAGHLGYIEYICRNRALPDFNPTTRWSFYNPPAHHLLAATVLNFFLALGIPEGQSWELLQYLPALYIMATAVGGYLVLRRFGVKKALGVAILSFHPSLSFLATSLNNDALALALTVWAVYFALRWYDEPRTRWIVGTALTVGAGMMTKLTVALVAPAIAILFLYRFFCDKTWIAHIKQFSVFAAVCVPLGLFWPLRNMWLYDMPFNYVQKLPESIGQYIGNATLWERFGCPPLSDFTRVVSEWDTKGTLGYPDRNLWSQTLRSALFDDNALAFRSARQETLAAILMVVTLALALVTVAVTVVGLIRRRDVDSRLRWFVAVAALLLLGNYVIFCKDYPWTCTIHFRYILPVLLYGGIGIGLWWQGSSRTPLRRTVQIVLATLTVVFCGLSAYLCAVGMAPLTA